MLNPLMKPCTSCYVALVLDSQLRVSMLTSYLKYLRKCLIATLLSLCLTLKQVGPRVYVNSSPYCIQGKYLSGMLLKSVRQGHALKRLVVELAALNPSLNSLNLLLISLKVRRVGNLTAWNAMTLCARLEKSWLLVGYVDQQ